MKKSFTQKHNIRKSFGKIPDLVDMPNLLEIQKNSYDLFLQKDVKPEDREDIGLQAVFNKVFPITDFSGIAELRFVKYELEDPRYDVDECIQRGGTYGSLLKVTLNLIVREVDEETGVSSVKDIKEQDVYLGDMPLMTSKGTFVFNGTTRVVVSQMHRSPGVFFDHDKGKSHSTGKFLFASRLIPYNGSWIDFEFDGKDLIGVKYKQLWSESPMPYKNPENAFRIISGDFVNTDEGTGIVHTAPTFGADDAKAAKDANPEVPPMLIYDKNNQLVPLVDLNGRFRPELGFLGGKYVKNERN